MSCGSRFDVDTEGYEFHHGWLSPLLNARSPSLALAKHLWVAWGVGAHAARSCFPSSSPRVRSKGRLGDRLTVALASASLAEVNDAIHAMSNAVSDVMMSMLGSASRICFAKDDELSGGRS
jgi:hypothetical protein